MTRPPRAPALSLLFLLVLAACTGPRDSADATGAPQISPLPSPLIDPDDIVEVLPPDQIPAIDDPRFVAPDAAGPIEPQEPVVALEVAGDARAYPVRILTWHEIVNDRVGGVPVAVTYCPLCNTAVVFERPMIDGQLLDFGTSGSLYRSNLVMYDRQTRSYWPQATGQAAIGPLTGHRLKLLPAQLVSFGDWRAEHPDGLVLSARTGATRPYGENPYVDYDRPSSRPSLFVGELDPRLPPKARILGILADGRALAIPYAVLTGSAVDGRFATVRASVAGTEVVVFWRSGTVSALDRASIAASRDVGASAAYLPAAAGRSLTFVATPEGIADEQTGSTWSILGTAVEGPLAGERLEPAITMESFWFAWASFYPETEVLSP